MYDVEFIMLRITLCVRCGMKLYYTTMPKEMKNDYKVLKHKNKIFSSRELCLDDQFKLRIFHDIIIYHCINVQ